MNQPSRDGKLGWLQVRDILSGLLSYNNILFLIVIIASVYIFKIIFLNEKPPYQWICLLWIGILVSGVIVCAMVKIFLTKGEAGPPETYYREGDKYLALINQSFNLSEMHKIFPKLPSPDGIINGDAKNKNDIKELSEGERNKWSQNDDIETIKQAIIAITTPSDKIETTEKLKLELEKAGESSHEKQKS